MKKLFSVILMLLLAACNVNTKYTTYDALVEIGFDKDNPDKSEKFDLDSRISYVQNIYLDSAGTIHFKNEKGLVSIYFVPTLQEDGTLKCEISGIYLVEYKNIAFGPVENAELINEYLGGDTTFTLYINEENVVTADKWPELIVE